MTVRSMDAGLVTLEAGGRAEPRAPSRGAAVRVLVITGGMLSAGERSLASVLRKQRAQSRAASSAWLDAKIKAVAAEYLLAGRLEQRRPAAVADYFDHADDLAAPQLTEVVLATLLDAEGIPYDTATYDEMFASPHAFERKLRAAGCVFASTTLLRDLSEVEPLVARLKRPHNRIVLGGALAGTLAGKWDGHPDVDLVAVGYGELLVGPLAAWIRSGFRRLPCPPRGRIVDAAHSTFVHSGVPESTDLDFLVRPDWGLAERHHGRRFPMIHYESVRGCPYRCAFCNYPFLFDDTRFRYRSARRIADDWRHYVDDLGVRYITCLDSLFTMPRRRLIELCRLLVERETRVSWICYARATDLLDAQVVALMRRAGCIQVQIGVESGDATLLGNMNKMATVEENGRALDLCREHGITTLASVIVGYPGETEETLERTYRFLRDHPPDFFFLATFSTRVQGVPVLAPQSRARFGLVAADNRYAVSPYWVHDTMSCADVGNHVRRLQRRLMEDRVALDGALFYGGIIHYDREARAALLDFQQRVVRRHPLVRLTFDAVNRWIDRRLRRDVEAFRAAAVAAAMEHADA